MAELDHLMWGASDLATGMAEVRSLFGVEPILGGVHAGLGTHNALLSLSPAADVYLEIIAPVPGQSVAGLAAGLRNLDECALVTWAARSHDLASVAANAAQLGLTARGPLSTTRQTPGGDKLTWELLFLTGHGFGNQVPFFIDWLGSPHPAQTSPLGGESVALTLVSPQPDELRQLLATLDLQVVVIPGASAIQARVKTSAATAEDVTLISSSGTRDIGM